MSTHEPHDVPPSSPGGDPSYQQPSGYGSQAGQYGVPQHQQQGAYAQQPAPQTGYGTQQQYQGGYPAPAGYGYDPNGHAQPGGTIVNPYDPRRVGTHPGISVGPVDAVKRFYSKYAQFSGRASRSEYWWPTLALFTVSMVLYVLALVAGTDRYGELNGFGGLLLILLFLFFLGNIVPSVAVSVRRLHDADLPGLAYLVNFIPFIGGFIMLIFMLLPPKPQGARFDR